MSNFSILRRFDEGCGGSSLQPPTFISACRITRFDVLIVNDFITSAF